MIYMIELANFEMIRDMYKKDQYLADLVHLKFEEGLHCGRWEDEAYMDETAENYLHEMKKLADKYNIEYISDNLNIMHNPEENLKGDDLYGFRYVLIRC